TRNTAWGSSARRSSSPRPSIVPVNRSARRGWRRANFNGRQRHTFTRRTRMKIKGSVAGLLSVVLTLAVSSVRAEDKKDIKIGMVAKSQSNAVFQAAYAGAKAAAAELGPKYNANVTIDWQTPADEDAQKQAQAIG